jgi:nucleotide-binding universal stress UspA family protein
VARDVNARAPHERIEETTRALLRDAGVDDRNSVVHIVSGDPAHSIRVLADKIRADVIVLGPHRPGIERGNRLGSTALAIVTASWAPCLVVAGTMRLPIERVLVPLDVSDTARGALLVALSWASALRRKVDDAAAGVHLTAVHVRQSPAEGESPPMRQLDADLARARADAGTWAGVAIEGPELVPGDPATAVAAHATEHSVDLIVLGTRGLGLDSTGRLGSVSAEVARLVDVPILLVPPAVWQTHSKTE